MDYSCPSLESNRLVKQMAKWAETMESVARFSGLPRGSACATVRDVDDPQERGRVRVLFDMVNSNVPQVQGGQARRAGTEQLSHWINVCPAFKGKQPPGLIDKRVTVFLPNSLYEYAVLQDVIYDPESLTDTAGGDLKQPNNSSMVRLPIYPAGQLPPPCEENHGCMVIELDGPMESDWMCICMKRDERYLWVRHCDLAHGHAGGNDCSQAPDSLGNRQNPVMMAAVSDKCFPTTACQFVQDSAYTTKCAGNPKGDRACWHPSPMSDDKTVPGVDGPLLTTDPNVAVDIVRGEAGFPAQDLSISGFTASLEANIPTVIKPDALAALRKAQKYLALAAKAKEIIDNPLEFAKAEALRAAQGGVNQLTAGIGGVAGDAVNSVASAAISGAASGITGGLSAAASGAASAATNAIEGAVGNAAGSLASGAVSAATDALGNVAEDVVEKYVPPAVANALGNITNVEGFLKTAAVGAVKKVFKGPLDGLNSLASAATSAAGSAIRSITSSIFG